MAAVTVRGYQDKDHAAVVAIWKTGFYELGPQVIRSLTPSLSVALGLGIFAGALSDRPLLLLGSVASLFTLHAFPSAVGTALIAPGVEASYRKDMTPDKLPLVWGRHGVSTFFVAVGEDGEVLGCGAVRRGHTLLPPSEAPTTEASMWRLAVAPSARRRGVGRALVLAATEWCAAHGYTRLTLITGNNESKRMYAACGFVGESLDACYTHAGVTAGSIRGWHLQRRVASGNILVKEIGK